MIRRALLVTLMMLMSISFVSASSGLEAQVSSVFGINRTVSGDAQALAAQRAVQVVTDWSHNGVPAGYAEVIAKNTDLAGGMVRAVNQWLTSPPHAAILSDSRYTQIGCAAHVDGGWYYAVCLLPWGTATTDSGAADSGSAGGTGNNQNTVTPAPTRSPEPQVTITLLPNTSTLAGKQDK